MTDRTPLLLTVAVNVPDENAPAFNEWYHTHIPRLLAIPGYRWGRRYRSVIDATAYLAVYEIADPSWIPFLLGPDESIRPDVANSEFANWNHLHGLHNITINVYHQLSGPPFTHLLMSGDNPIVTELANTGPAGDIAIDRWYEDTRMPTMLATPGILSASRFRLIEDVALARLDAGSRHLAIYESESLDTIGAGDPHRQFIGPSPQGAPRGAQLAIDTFRPIAKHWPIELTPATAFPIEKV